MAELTTLEEKLAEVLGLAQGCGVLRAALRGRRRARRALPAPPSVVGRLTLSR